MTLKERAILFAPMMLILTLTCASTYAYVPKTNMFLNDAYLTENFIYLKDRDNNRWRLSPDCNFELNVNDTPKVKVHSRSIREGTRVTIQTRDDYKTCRVESLVRL